MIAHAHVVAMKCVDQIKIPPHEPIAPVDTVKASFGDAGPRVKVTPGSDAAFLQSCRRHAARLERDSIVTVTIVEPPALVKQAALALEARI